MTDLFPHVRATLKAHSYFVTTLSGFSDAQGRFKVFREGEAPSTQTPFITVQSMPGSQHQLTGWARPFVTFTVNGKDTQWDTLWEVAETVRDIFQATTCFAAVGEDDPLHYQMIGESEFDTGQDPVLELVNVSVALRFGIAL